MAELVISEAQRLSGTALVEVLRRQRLADELPFQSLDLLMKIAPDGRR
jgi:hypothetical protein